MLPGNTTGTTQWGTYNTTNPNAYALTNGNGGFLAFSSALSAYGSLVNLNSIQSYNGQPINMTLQGSLSAANSGSMNSLGQNINLQASSFAIQSGGGNVLSGGGNIAISTTNNGNITVASASINSGTGSLSLNAGSGTVSLPKGGGNLLTDGGPMSITAGKIENASRIASQGGDMVFVATTSFTNSGNIAATPGTITITTPAYSNTGSVTPTPTINP